LGGGRREEDCHFDHRPTRAPHTEFPDKVFQKKSLSLFRRGFQTEKNLKSSKSFQTGIPDREKSKKFKVFSERDSKQRKYKKFKYFQTGIPDREKSKKFKQKSFQTGIPDQKIGNINIQSIF